MNARTLAALSDAVSNVTFVDHELADARREIATARSSVVFHDPVDAPVLPRREIAPLPPVATEAQIKVAHGLIAGTFFVTFSERCAREVFDARYAALRSGVPGLRFIPAKRGRGRAGHKAGYSVPTTSRKALIEVLRAFCAGQTCEGPEGKVTVIGSGAPASSKRFDDASVVYPFTTGERRDAQREEDMVDAAERAAIQYSEAEDDGEPDVDAYAKDMATIQSPRGDWTAGFAAVSGRKAA